MTQLEENSVAWFKLAECLLLTSQTYVANLVAIFYDETYLLSVRGDP